MNNILLENLEKILKHFKEKKITTRKDIASEIKINPAGVSRYLCILESRYPIKILKKRIITSPKNKSSHYEYSIKELV